MPDREQYAFTGRGPPEAGGGAKMSGAAHVSRVSHAAGGGHHTPPPVLAAKARKLWDADDPNQAPEGPDMPSNVPQVHPVYARMDFAEYEYREYPKFIGTDPANPQTGVIVNDEDEEAQLRSAGTVVREDDERSRLIKVAEVKGVKIDKRWSAAKMGAAIAEAGFDPDLNPFE